MGFSVRIIGKLTPVWKVGLEPEPFWWDWVTTPSRALEPTNLGDGTIPALTRTIINARGSSGF